MKKLILLLLILCLVSSPAMAVLTAGDVTIKLTGGTYSTWAGFWDDLGGLTGDINCTVDASAFTESTAPVAVLEKLNSHTLHVFPASFPTKTDATTGARFTCNYTGVVLNMGMAGPGAVIIEGMAFIGGTSTPARVLNVNSVATPFTLTFRRNIIKGAYIALLFVDSDVDYDVYNNIIYDNGFGFYTGGNVLGVLANNTIVNSSSINFNAANLIVTSENNISYGAATNDFSDISNAAIGNNNADSDSTGEDADWETGSDNVSGISDPFNALASDDFTITAEGDVGTAGKDLSASFTDDFFGVTRVNWTIGACEYVSGWSGEFNGTTDPSVQTLSAGTTVADNAGTIQVVGNGGAVTLTGTPTISPGVDGQRLLIRGTHDTNTVTLQDVANLGGSALWLGGVDFAMTNGDRLWLEYDGTLSAWVEISRTDN